MEGLGTHQMNCEETEIRSDIFKNIYIKIFNYKQINLILNL